MEKYSKSDREQDFMCVATDDEGSMVVGVDVHVLCMDGSSCMILLKLRKCVSVRAASRSRSVSVRRREAYRRYRDSLQLSYVILRTLEGMNDLCPE